MNCEEVLAFLMAEDDPNTSAEEASSALDRAEQVAVHISDCHICLQVLNQARAVAMGGAHGNAVAMSHAPRAKA